MGINTVRRISHIIVINACVRSNVTVYGVSRFKLDNILPIDRQPPGSTYGIIVLEAFVLVELKKIVVYITKNVG